jgi:hypothetical protein
VARVVLRSGPTRVLRPRQLLPKFIWNFDIIVAPVTRLLRRDTFAWDDKAEAAFQALKGALTMGSVL